MERLAMGLFLMVALGVVNGCTTTALTTPPGPAPFREGFRDGCDSGYVAAGNPLYREREDAEKAASSEQYRAGWFTGFTECRANFQRIQRTVYLILGP